MSADKLSVTPKTTASPQTLEELLKPFAGKEAFYRRLIAIFEKNLAEQLNDINTLIDQHNTRELMVLVHTLKGTSGTAGFSALYRALYDWELKLTQLDASNAEPNTSLYADLGQQITAIAHSELAHIHALLATSTDNQTLTKPEPDTESHNITFSLAQLTNEFDELNQLLRQGNLDAIAQCQALQTKLAADTRLIQELIALCDSVEALDFDTARAQLSSLSTKLK
ncbi:Hpt domain-containing protein [Shewanella sp. MF05960]